MTWVCSATLSNTSQQPAGAQRPRQLAARAWPHSCSDFLCTGTISQPPAVFTSDVEQISIGSGSCLFTRPCRQPCTTPLCGARPSPPSLPGHCWPLLLLRHSPCFSAAVLSPRLLRQPLTPRARAGPPPGTSEWGSPGSAGRRGSAPAAAAPARAAGPRPAGGRAATRAPSSACEACSSSCGRVGAEGGRRVGIRATQSAPL